MSVVNTNVNASIALTALARNERHSAQQWSNFRLAMELVQRPMMLLGSLALE